MELKLIKNFNDNVVTWEDTLNNFNESALNNEIIKHNPFGFFGSHSAHKIEKVKLVLNELKLNTAHLYFNITIKGNNFGNHKDLTDLYFWQCIGKTKWVIEEQKEYILEAGDLLIVPKSTFHNVFALTPRVGISMSNIL